MAAPPTSKYKVPSIGKLSTRLPKFPFVVRLWAALVIFTIASLVTIFQPTRPDAFHRPGFPSVNWFLYPLEWNAPSRLPKLGVTLNAIQVVPNTNHVWAVGNKGMVVTSTDGGVTWETKGIRQAQIISPSSTPTPTPTPARLQSFLNLPDLIPTAEAAEISKAEPQDRNLSNRPGTPRPTPISPNASNPNVGAAPTPTPRRSTAATVPQGVPRPRPTPRRSTAATDPRGEASPTPTPLPEADPTPDVTNASLIAVRFLDNNRGEVVSSTGSRFLTSNAGTNWQVGNPITFRGNRSNFRSLFLLSENSPSTEYVYVLGSGMVFYDTGDSELNRTGYGPADGVHSLPGGKYTWVVGSGYRDEGVWYGGVWRTQAGGGSENLKDWLISENSLHGVFFVNDNRGWVAGSNGVVFNTMDGGKTWPSQASGTRSLLKSINFHPDGQHGWIAGNDGLILSTDDGGATWVPRTQGKDASGRYLRFPAPWYFLILFLIGLTLLRRTQTILPDPEESVADVLVSDRPLDTALDDVLAFNSIALGLSRFLRNENTLPPLSIAIIGEWGTGKSSLMNLLRADLRSYKFRPVWFNAWHHQKEEHMLASLLENIKLQAVPRWWTVRGVAFRANLLGIRGWRRWLPMLALLFVFYVMGLYYWNQFRAGSTPAELINNLTVLFSQPIVAATGLVKWLPLLAGLVALFGTIWRGMTAFGVKPASLLAGVSRSASIRSLEAQTSFRQKFAVEFSDVTRALNKHFLLIFIDDLDRCRPENVLETLEAVNFLTTSGECFVVIGMAREYVERCVGRAFKDIAEEMIDDLDEEPTRPEGRNPDDLAKKKRVEFARQYLDKLINIEVPVPTAKQPQSLDLLLAGASQLQKAESRTQWQEFTSSSRAAMRRYWKVLPAVLILLALFFVGSFLANSWIPGLFSTNLPAATPSPSPTPNPSHTAIPTPSVSSRSGPTPTPLPTPTPTPTAVATPAIDERAEIVAGGTALISRYLLPVLALFFLVWFGVSILTRRPGLIVKDSPNFLEALKIWHALVFSRQSTPRSIKRFMNRIRYLAMRQRPTVAEQRPSLIQKLFSWRTAEDHSATVSTQATDAASEPQRIPDEALVALAALQKFSPQHFGKLPAEWDLGKGPLAKAHPDAELSLLAAAVAGHRSKFGNFDVMKYRERFLEMSADVKVR